jgi:two-component system, chemotaxis family, chemotaxis protein CheY
MSKTILIVDDSQSTRITLNHTLQDAGYKTVEATDGSHALDQLGQHKIDLIVCDLYMPNMDGISLLKAIRLIPQYKFMPILMLTSSNESNRINEGRAAGIKAWLTKPFEPATLVNAVTKLVPLDDH